LIVDSGMTANTAAHSIREVDHGGSIALLTNASTYGLWEPRVGDGLRRPDPQQVDGAALRASVGRTCV
jgi:hypothetical protein